MDTLLTMLRQVLTQDVARGNAAQASAQLMDHRRQREDVDAYLTAHLDAHTQAAEDGAPPRAAQPGTRVP